MGESVMQKVARMSEKEREAIIGDIPPEQLLREWRLWARPEQLPPDHDEWDVWAYIAGRGCVSGATRIYLPLTDENVPIAELAKRGDPVTVLTLDGPAVTDGPPFVKAGPTPMYEVELAGGQRITVTAKHRFLTPQGWLRLADVSVGQPLASGPPASSTPGLIDWQAIVAIRPVGPRVVYDLTVPVHEHYVAEGVWSHNSGKTRAGAQWVIEQVRDHGIRRVALVGRASADVRDIQVQGESGIEACSPPDFMPVYEPSKRRLLWPNGAIAQTFSAEEPDQLRGPQFDCAWADEVGSWKFVPDSAGTTAWDNLRLGLRLGGHPKLLVTTTPRRLPVIRELLNPATPGVVVTHSTTWDNAANLPDSYTNTLRALYEGSALERQELQGLLVEDVEGALWTSQIIDDNRVSSLYEALPHRFVGVDPSVAERPRDECGIVVVGATGERRLYERRAYVLEDASLQAAPDVWAREVVRQARKWGCPVVAETNQGGALVRMTLQTIDPGIQVFEVTSRAGKRLRAEPIVAATAQARVKFLGYMPQLEDQLCTWNPEVTKDSPDRLDACLAEGTLVETTRGHIPIEQVLVGDLAMTRRGWRRVLASACTGQWQQTYRVTTDRGHFDATEDHLVWVDGAFRRVDEIGDGMLALWRAGARSLDGTDIDELATQTRTSDLTESAVLRVEPIGRANVYDLMIEEAHEFFANGHLVHNCVFAATALLVQPPKGYIGGGHSGLVAKSSAYARLPAFSPAGSSRRRRRP